MSLEAKEILNELASLRALVSEIAVSTNHSLPEYYKFPEDIITMTGGHIPKGTIRRWKTEGYLRTIKIGRRSYVTAAAWKWFLANHSQLMAAAPNNRGTRLKVGPN